MSFENNIKKMYTEFTDGQKHWFRYYLPHLLQDWVLGGFNGKQTSKNPQLIESYLDKGVVVAKAQKANVLDGLLLALWCIRKCHGPIHAPTLYRLTKIPKLAAGAKKVSIECTNSLKPITSWSDNPDVTVHDRNPSTEDYLLKAENIPSKYVLTTIDIVHEFAKLILRNVEFFGLKEKFDDSYKPFGGIRIYGKHTGAEMWKVAIKDIQSYLDEKEYILYLHPHEKIHAEVVRKIERQSSKVKIKLKPKQDAKFKPKEIKVHQPNPFMNKIGGMDKLTPKAQVKMLRGLIAKTPVNENTIRRLDDMKRNLRNMLDFAERFSIDV